MTIFAPEPSVYGACPLCFEDDCQHWPGVELVEPPTPAVAVTDAPEGLDGTPDAPIAPDAVPVIPWGPIDRSEPDWPKPRRSAESRFIREVLEWRLKPLQERAIDIIYRHDIETAVLRWGRQSGKGRTAAAVAVTEATLRGDEHLRNAPPGEQIAVVIVAKATRQAKHAFRYCKQFAHVATRKLGLSIVRETQDEIELSNGMVIIVLPAHAASSRGSVVAVLLFDEIGWFEGRDESVLDAREVWNALEPSTVTMPSRRILALSTPRYAGSFFSELCAAAATREDRMIELHASTPQMRPDLADGFFERKRRRDPAYYAREYEARFDSGEGAALPADLLMAAAIEPAGHVPIPGVRYLIATDPATRRDRWTMVAGYLDGNDDAHLVEVGAMSPSGGQPVKFEDALDWLAAKAKRYNGAEIVADQAMSSVVEEGLRRRNVRVRVANWTGPLKSDALASFRSFLFEDRLRMVRHAAMLEELVILRQTVGPSGAPRIGAPGSKHDDYAMSALMLAHELSRQAARGGDVILSNLDVWDGATTDGDPVRYWNARTGEPIQPTRREEAPAHV